MTFGFRRRFPPLKGGLAHVGLLWLRSLVTTFTNPIAPWKRERLPFVPDLVCWPPRDRQLHFPFSTSPTPPYNTTDTLSCQIVDLNIGSGARFAAGLQELHAKEIIQGTSTCASSPLF